MLDDLLANGTELTEIPLFTRDGMWKIPNGQCAAPDELAVQQYLNIRNMVGQSWRHRKGPCGMYNCHGLVFASRRTGIFEDEHILEILKRDGYHKISDRDVRVGDVVIYVDRTSRGILHSAVVVGVKSTTSDVLPPKLDVFAISKWTASHGEDIHHVNDTWYARLYKEQADKEGRESNLLIEYYSERHEGKDGCDEPIRCPLVA